MNTVIVSGTLLIIAKTRRQVTPISLTYLIIPLILGATPLATTFGQNWEYESVLIISTISVLILPILATVPSVRFLLPNPEKLGTKRYLTAIFIWMPILLATTGLTQLWSGKCQCSASGFMTWFLLLAFPAQTIGLGVAGWIIESSKKNNLRKVSLTVAAFYLAAISSVIAIIWLDPQN